MLIHIYIYIYIYIYICRMQENECHREREEFEKSAAMFARAAPRHTHLFDCRHSFLLQTPIKKSAAISVRAGPDRHSFYFIYWYKSTKCARANIAADFSKIVYMYINMYILGK